MTERTVCEDHPDQEWDEWHQEFCGAGMQPNGLTRIRKYCPQCTPGPCTHGPEVLGGCCNCYPRYDELPLPVYQELRRPRWWAQLRASVSGYFWLPCPDLKCGQMFAGFECGDQSVGNKVACKRHDHV